MPGRAASPESTNARCRRARRRCPRGWLSGSMWFEFRAGKQREHLIFGWRVEDVTHAQLVGEWIPGLPDRFGRFREIIIRSTQREALLRVKQQPVGAGGLRER